MRGRDPSESRFRTAHKKIEDLTKPKTFCGKLLQKESFIILTKNKCWCQVHFKTGS